MAASPPVLRCPAEITQSFLFCAYKADVFDWKNAYDRRFELCIVCTQWRKIIYTSSEFWLSVVVTRGHSTKHLAFVLEKSGGRALSLFILTREFELSKRPSSFQVRIPMTPMPTFITSVMPSLEPLYE
ncbi:hypothetical protein B0H12DRAFT_1240594 [Mycena haematopus]|nr:hypothetical protein B0H12DRAFT_1240594 [Mycena haematopus]